MISGATNSTTRQWIAKQEQISQVVQQIAPLIGILVVQQIAPLYN